MSEIYAVTFVNDDFPLKIFDTKEEAENWVMGHHSEWTNFLIEKICILSKVKTSPSSVF